jgi:hypothetical protein
MLFTAVEAKVFEQLRENGKQSICIIAGNLGLREELVSRVVNRLRAKNAISQLGRARYEVMIGNYEVGDELPEQETYEPINIDTSVISSEMREYVLAHAPYIRRSVLAKRTKIPKLLLNQLLYEMGEGKKHA